jgi:hypothetical protein
VVLQTMGEMCLAEEMFEQARQVFERLLKTDPNKPAYLELLNRARAGLGLGPVGGPPPARAYESREPAAALPRPELEPVAVRRSGVAGEQAPPPQLERPTFEWAAPAPMPAEGAPPPAAAKPAPAVKPAPARPLASVSPSLAKLPSMSMATPEGAKIERTAHALQLGELPPATPSNVDFDDDIIE